jgi:AcrR family transcriptional regulator
MDEPTVPSPRGRGRPRSDASQRAILDATRRLLEERGFVGLTMEEVALRAGVGKTTIYRRWPTKGTLAFEAFMLEFLAQQPLPDTGNLRDDLLASLRSWIRAVKGTVTGRTLVGLIAEVQRDPELAEVWREKFVAPVRAQHRLMIAKAIDRHEIDATTDVDVTLDLVFGAGYHRLLQSHLPLNDKFARSVVDVIVRGLVTDPPTAR